MTWEIAISAEIAQMANNHALERIKFEYDRFGLPANSRISMITIGTIGQLVFKDYLEIQEIPFEFQMQAGKYDDYDFTIDGKKIEVKTSGFENRNDWENLNAIYNVNQMKAAVYKKYTASVQIFVNGYDKSTRTFDYKKCNHGIIAGWQFIDFIASVPKTNLPLGKAHLVPLKKLFPIETLC